ncbi:membrane-spanning 4-domains subfamily A member 14 [Dasypus novemcinctus]|uniref:membrane-spanning 4-domains subfamily A member 14 n=1 Tax=Dasypus novemcinctus TaxID=9361 RepID=UPI00265FF84B|nr:membrane-spanning 4-domains subfamily A member 14 [Dasypus novemcinctus]
MQRVNNSSWTAETDTAKEFTVNIPGSENTVHPGKSGSLALPSNPQNNLLIFLKGQPQVLGVAQILIGLMELCLWVTTVASYTKFSYRGYDLNFIIVTGYPVWGSLFVSIWNHSIAFSL